MYSLCTSLDRLLQLLIIQSIAHLCTFAASYLPQSFALRPHTLSFTTHPIVIVYVFLASVGQELKWNQDSRRSRTKSAGMEAASPSSNPRHRHLNAAYDFALAFIFKRPRTQGHAYAGWRMQDTGILSIVCRTAATTSESCSISPSSSRHALMAQGEYQPTVYSAGRQKC